MTYRLLVTLHLLGATVWVGGHLVLLLSVLPRALRARDPAIIREFETGFERLGIPALLVQIVTGLWLAYHWAPHVAGWFSPSTPQARLVLVKLVLLGATVALAVHARLRVVRFQRRPASVSRAAGNRRVTLSVCPGLAAEGVAANRLRPSRSSTALR